MVGGVGRAKIGGGGGGSGGLCTVLIANPIGPMGQWACQTAPCLGTCFLLNDGCQHLQLEHSGETERRARCGIQGKASN